MNPLAVHVSLTGILTAITSYHWGLLYGALVLFGLLWLTSLGMTFVGITEAGRDRRGRAVSEERRRAREETFRAMRDYTSR